jgi:RNA polymerase sigma-70 factor (ECF subfamily)
MADDFATTHWSLVLAAGDRKNPAAGEAVARLCESYWYPLYVFVRRQVKDVHEAQDFTQAFFTRLLEQRPFETVDPNRGRLRAFLLTACKRFLINEWHKHRAVKRGGWRRSLSLDFDSGEWRYSHIAVDPMTAEKLYDRQWAITLLDRVLEQLQTEYSAKDRMAHFATLKNFLAGSPQGASYAEAARTLGISVANAKVAAHRMRQRYRELLRAEIAQTVQLSDQIDDEIRDLFAILGDL